MIFWVNHGGMFPDPVPEFIQEAIGSFFGLKYRHLQKLLTQHEVEFVEFRKLRQYEWALYHEEDGGCITVDSQVDLKMVRKYVLKRNEFELQPDEVALYLLFASLGNSEVVARKLGLNRPDREDHEAYRKYRQTQMEVAARYAIENINILREYRDSLPSLG